MASAPNPLLHPDFRVPFDRIGPDHVRPAVDAHIATAHERLTAIKNVEGSRTYENTLHALEESTRELEFTMTVVGHLESVATTPDLREAYNDVQPDVSSFYAGLPLDADLWAAVKAYADSVADDDSTLSPTKRRLLDKTVRFFVRSGANLEPEKKARLQELGVELAQATTKFSQNVLDATNAWELVIDDDAKLAGLPPSAIDAARASAESKGIEGWRFTLQAPSYIALVTYLDDASIREQAWRAYNTRAAKAPYDNRERLDEIVALRRERAALLGFSDFSDLVLAERMAHDGATARAFVDDLRAKTEPHAKREAAELAEFRRRLEGAEAPELAPWDVSYYSEKLRRESFDFDEEALRPYFPMPKVVAGMFEVATRLYGIDIRRNEDMPTWDKEVRVYDVFDGDEKLGSFYTDFFPRENKRGGAWMNGLLTGEPGSDGWDPHLGLICANATPPVGDKPSLLTHNDVETLFHEFGHLLHHLLSRVEVRGLGGTNVAWDFVELPSQIMENWCWEREALDLFARHYESGAAIPDELFAKMSRARTFRGASAMMRQLSFATVDLALHRDFEPATHGAAADYARKVMAEFSVVPLPADYAMIASFGHLFGSSVGYAAGYYSYKWAEVLDADAFTRFQQEGLFSREVGNDFRGSVLARGDSADPAELFRDFMGREPQQDALLRRTGLAG